MAEPDLRLDLAQVSRVFHGHKVKKKSIKVILGAPNTCFIFPSLYLTKGLLPWHKLTVLRMTWWCIYPVSENSEYLSWQPPSLCKQENKLSQGSQRCGSLNFNGLVSCFSSGIIPTPYHHRGTSPKELPFAFLHCGWVITPQCLYPSQGDRVFTGSWSPNQQVN